MMSNPAERHLTDAELVAAAQAAAGRDMSLPVAQRHLQGCATCARAFRELVAISTFSDSGIPAPRFAVERAYAIPMEARADRVFGRIKRWTRATLAVDTATATPAFVVRRAGTAPAPSQTVWRWERGELTLRWTPGRLRRVTGHWEGGSLLGVVEGSIGDDALVELSSLGRSRKTQHAAIDRNQEFQFEPVDPGDYRLRLVYEGGGIEIEGLLLR